MMMIIIIIVVIITIVVIIITPPPPLTITPHIDLDRVRAKLFNSHAHA
jgi:hypothetical protein